MPLIYIAYIGWYLAVIYFFGETARWFFNTDSWWIVFIAWPLAALASFLPGGVIAVCGLIFYYLAFVRDWNLLVAFAFVFPGLAFTAVMLLGGGLSAIFQGMNERR